MFGGILMMRFKYTHLATWLKEQIKSGTYKDGDRIPTEIEHLCPGKRVAPAQDKRKRHLRAHFLQASSFSRWQGFQTHWHSYE